ncbi:hypothetical protein ABIB85_007781 [Bradyrhizobium sp. JR1.5]|uniref:hypothetical protein n=1 Tax=unclassified Bradyrhizobium TaxID=2631580 RepID=UPI0033986EC9
MALLVDIVELDDGDALAGSGLAAREVVELCDLLDREAAALLVAQEMGDKAPRWLAIRNVSDPQIKAEGTLKQQEQIAAQIYKGFG